MAGHASEGPAVPVGETVGPSTFTFESTRRNAHGHGGTIMGVSRAIPTHPPIVTDSRINLGLECRVYRADTTGEAPTAGLWGKATVGASTPPATLAVD
jgi:hypothetical protein